MCNSGTPLADANPFTSILLACRPRWKRSDTARKKPLDRRSRSFSHPNGNVTFSCSICQGEVKSPRDQWVLVFILCYCAHAHASNPLLIDCVQQNDGDGKHSPAEAGQTPRSRGQNAERQAQVSRS